MHDKIEFEVTASCRTFDVVGQRQWFKESGLTESQIVDVSSKLLALTDRIILGAEHSIDEQLDAIAKLENRRAKILSLDSSNPTTKAIGIDSLLDDCQVFGLVPFAVLARYAFIAIEL